jgi:hypothetical protein
MAISGFTTLASSAAVKGMERRPRGPVRHLERRFWVGDAGVEAAPVDAGRLGVN